MTLQEFYDALEWHDWHYQYSDDRSVYKRGDEQQRKIEQWANEHPEHKRLFDEFAAYVRGSGPKPERPQ